jgi:hypothetical protein
MSCMMLLAIISEQIWPTTKSDGPIREIPVCLLEWLLHRVYNWYGFGVARMDFIWSSSNDRAIFCSGLGDRYQQKQTKTRQDQCFERRCASALLS